MMFILQVLAGVPSREISDKFLPAPEDDLKEIVMGKELVYY